MLKRLDELSNLELKDVFDEAGMDGEFTEAELVIRLTIYLVKVGKNPFTFQFDIVKNPKSNDVMDVEVVESGDVSSPGLADGLSARSSSLSLPQTKHVLLDSCIKPNDIVCEEIEAKDIEAPKDQLGSNPSLQTAGSAGSSSLLDLSTESSSVSLLSNQNDLDGSTGLSTPEADCASFSSSLFAGDVPESLWTLPRCDGSSSRISMETCFMNKSKPVLWPPDSCIVNFLFM